VAIRAQQPQSQTAAPAAAGLISGRVLDPGTGKPVPEAVVTMRIGGDPSADPRVLTDPDGQFVFVNVPAGRYSLEANKLGYITGSYGQRIYESESKKFDLSAGQLATDLTVPIWKWAALGGRVTDEAGQPVVGVRVQAVKRVVSQGQIRFELYSGPASSKYGTTDDRGVFRIPALPPGEYGVAVPIRVGTMPIEAIADLGNGARLPLDAYKVSPEIGLLGSARTQQVGSSVLLTENTQIIQPAPTDDGMPMVYRTTYSPGTTRVAEATVAALNPGDERSDLNIVLRPVRAVRVSGRLLGPSGPMPQTSVLLLPVNDAQAVQMNMSNTAGALTDANGRFAMLGVPEGDYVATMYNGDPRGGMQFVAEAVHVGSAEISDLTLTMKPAPHIRGRFDLRGAKPPAQSNTLFAFLDPGVPGLPSMGLISQPDLTFDTSVPSGWYEMRVLAQPPLACTAVMRDGRDIADEKFVVADQDIDLTIVCTDSPNRLSGSVRKDDGSAEPDAMVVAFPVDRQAWANASSSARRFRGSPVDNGGGFTMINVPAGDYFVAAIPLERSNLWQDPKRLDLIARSATRVSIAATDARSIDLRVTR
jgi:hypothetical protein